MRWALVLSGGGARGLAHIGVIRELERLGAPRPGFVAGTSMGAIIGAMYALGWDSARMEAYATRFDPRDFVDNPAFRLPDLGISRVVQAGAALGAIVRGRSVDSGNRARAELGRVFGDVRIEDMPTPFACTASDLASGALVVQDSGELADAVRASISFPGVFAPVQRGSALLVDGGVLDNMPCDLAAARGFRRTLASDVSPFMAVDPRAIQNGMSVLMRCFDVASERAQGPVAALADLTITTVSERTAFDFDDPAAIVELGSRSARARSAELELFFRKGSSRMACLIDKLSAWKRSIVQ
jgi:NTE family protein